MSYRWLWCLGLAAPLACGRATESHPTLGQCGQGTGADATVAGGGATSGGMSGTTTGGSLVAGGGAGGTSTEVGAGAASGAGDGGSAGAEGGAGAQSLPLERPSCQALQVPCGTAQTSCCEAPQIPGGTFTRYQDSAELKVSGFRLDKYEVTVGRFRAFVDHYPSALPAPESGKNPADAQDPGWAPSWSAQLLPSSVELMAALDCSLRLASWDDQPADDENRPINCVTWYEAQAFCIWDGGRLPSDLEWEYAARGGDEERQLPWGDQVEPTPHAFANYYRGDCNVPQPAADCSGIAQIWPVGSAPGGDGRWGQSDLAGNLWEYTVDYFGPALSCSDCARHVPTPPASGHNLTHVSRGGAFQFDLGDGIWNRDFYYPTVPRSPDLGFRCAYDANAK